MRRSAKKEMSVKERGGRWDKVKWVRDRREEEALRRQTPGGNDVGSMKNKGTQWEISHDINIENCEK